MIVNSRHRAGGPVLRARGRRRLTGVPALLVLAIALGACGAGSQGDDSDPGAGNPQSAGTEADFDQALADAPPRLASIYEQGDALLEGGTEAFTSQLDELVGYPVVVNKWASWCKPCRQEFPMLRRMSAKYGDRVAFIGLNAGDSNKKARAFLRENPTLYPHVIDPSEQISSALRAKGGFPSTIFLDRDGDIVKVRFGPFPTEAKLEQAIRRYALARRPVRPAS